MGRLGRRLVEENEVTIEMTQGHGTYCPMVVPISGYFYG